MGLWVMYSGRVAGLENGNFPDGPGHIMARWPGNFMLFLCTISANASTICLYSNFENFETVVLF